MNEKQIFDYLVSKGMTQAGAAGMVGNMIHESGLRSNNLQNNYEAPIGLNDEQYTKAVDSGAYTNFVHDAAGYGLCQWTYHTRKAALLDFARSRGKSIGDCEMQLEFLIQELLSGFRQVWDVLVMATNIMTASSMVLHNFERPLDQSSAVINARAATSQGVYDRCAGKTGSNDMHGSKLAKAWVNFGTNKSNPRTEKVSKITIHHMAGNMGAEACAKWHLTSPHDHSANYYIGSDGVICLGVEENRRAWTSASNWNDQRAITIEVANSTEKPDWKVSGKAYNALIELCADICRRYKITPKYTGTKDGTLTCHFMYQATACPGPYLRKLHENGTIEKDILKAMGKTVEPKKEESKKEDKPVEKKKIYRVQAGAYSTMQGAKNKVAKLQKNGFEAFAYKANDGLFKVQAGAFEDKANAENLVQKLKGKKIDSFIV